MSSWFTLTEELDWTDDLPHGAEELPFRYAHLSAAVSTVKRHDYAPNLVSVDPSDAGMTSLSLSGRLGFRSVGGA